MRGKPCLSAIITKNLLQKPHEKRKKCDRCQWSEVRGKMFCFENVASKANLFDIPIHINGVRKISKLRMYLIKVAKLVYDRASKTLIN